MNITYANTVSAEDCNRLRNSAGWHHMHPDQIKAGLENSAFIVAAKNEETTVGMARVVSDGGYVFFIVDVLVLPEYLRKGIGKTMMKKIMEYIRGQLIDGYCIQAFFNRAMTNYYIFNLLKRKK